MYIKGEFVNDSTSTVYNDGVIEVTKDWTNNGSYNSNGEEIFSGDNPAFIKGTMADSDSTDFHNLHINKPNNQPITLDTDIDVDSTGSLYLHDGHIITGQYEVFVRNSDPASVFGHTMAGSAVDNNYVHGNLMRAVSDSLVHYDFPVGASINGIGYQLARIYITEMFRVSWIRMRFDKLPTSPPIPPFDSECGILYDCSLVGHGEWTFRSDGKPRYHTTVVPRNYTQDCGSLGTYAVKKDFFMLGFPCVAHVGGIDGVFGTEIERKGYAVPFAKFSVVADPDSAMIQCTRDVFEPNQTIINSVDLPLHGVNWNAQICPEDDEDWYKFIVGTKNNVLIRLSNLPIDAELEVYNSQAMMVQSSITAGTQDEVIVMNNLPVGSAFYIKVYAQNDLFSNQPYNLRVLRHNQAIVNIIRAPSGEIDEASFAELEETVTASTVNLYPNPTDQTTGISFYMPNSGSIQLTVRDVQGRIVLSQTKIMDAGEQYLTWEVADWAEGVYLVELQTDYVKHTDKLYIHR